MGKYTIKKIEVGNIANCTYVISFRKSNDAIIIDPAWEIEKIKNYLDRNNLRIKGILLTHSHYDHTNLVNELVEIYDCKVYISRKESEFYNYKCKNLVLVENLEILIVAKIEIQCLLTAGHTVGSMCYKLKEHLFTGDTLFIRSCGIHKCNGGDYNKLFESINNIKKIACKEKISIYPGHYFVGDNKYKDKYMEYNIYLNIRDKILFKKILEINSKKNEYLKYE